MSGQRAAAQPYTTRFETEVTAIDGTEVWLETSYFFPASDEQPADRGTIGGSEVTAVRRGDGGHVHVVAEPPSVRVGSRVLCTIDWTYRMYCMRAHTASHILFGSVRRLCESPTFTGAQIDEETVTLEFETDEPVSNQVLTELEAMSNRVVWESRPVSWETVQVSRARTREDIRFDESMTPAAVENGRVRLVTIGGPDDTGRQSSGDAWDVAACSGTHVRNTREVGPVTVTGCSTPKTGVRRIEFAVGANAIERRATEKLTALEAARLLETTPSDVPAALSRVIEQRERLRETVAQSDREVVQK